MNLEQHGFELLWSTYTQDFFSVNTTTVQGLLLVEFADAESRILKANCKIIIGFSIALGGILHFGIVQGSTVINHSHHITNANN